MNYIYTSTRDNSRYLLDPQVTMGNKVCLVNLSTCEDKFVSPKTLKRWYSLTSTEDVNNKFNEKFPKLNQYRGKGMQYHHDRDAYAQGQRDGRSAMDRRSLQQG